MAGVDTDFEGEARPQPGIKVGYLAQEPELDPTKTVRRAGRGVPGLCRGRRRLRRAGQGTGAPGGDPGRRRRAHPGKPAGRGRRCTAPAAVGCRGRKAVRW
ncbi:hypothetical protein G6F35_018032 [Rhizopus arrhizus]|nr:hypothetical protein G6F35_018032 [Rhizopus arrhizus]